MAIALIFGSVSDLTATTFFVSTTGNNSNNGTDLNTPFATIQRAADMALPGDTVIIRAGTYREQVTLPRSGTPGNPIVFEAFGSEIVTVTATDLLTGFVQTPESSDNNNVYSATLLGSTTNSLLNSHELTVFVDGQLLQAAKSRNSADYLRSNTWSTVDSNTGNGLTITDTDLRNLGDLTGGFIRIRTNDFSITNRRIVAYNSSAGQVTLESAVGSVNGRRYLAHDAQTLVDSPGEWYFNEENNEFFLWAPDGGDPDNFVVEVKRRAEAFDTNGNDYLHFRNLTLIGGDFETFANNAFSGSQSDHLLIENVHIIASDRNFSADFGTTRTSLNLSGDNNIIRSCEFEQIWSVAIRLRGSNNQVVNNFFHDAAFNGGGSGGIATSGDGVENLISHNTFTRMGRSAIVGSARRNLYQFNDFSETALITEDTGAVYSFNTSYEHSVFRFNTFHDINARLSTGFYIDNFTTDVAFHNNVTYNSTGPGAFGFKANEPNNFILHYNNTAFNTGLFDVAFGSFDNEYGSRFYNNIASSIDSDALNGSDPTDVQNNFLTGASSNFQNVGASDFRLRSGSGAVNAGREIPGITDGFAGGAPDAGAIELGQPLFATGHDFNANPTPVYDLTGPVFGANRVTNGSFEHGFEGFSLTGSPSMTNQIASNLRSDGLTRFGRRGVALGPDEAVTQTVTGLTPNTAYTLGGWAKPIRQIVEAESLNPSSTNTTVGNVRGQVTIGRLQNNDVLIYDNIDLSDVDELTLQIAQSDSGDQAQLRLDSANGPIVDTINLPSNTDLVRSSAAMDLSSVSGTHTLFLIFTGSGTLGQLESLRFSNSADRVRMEASGFGGIAAATQIANRVFLGPTPRLTFLTGPGATSANISLINSQGSNSTGYVDYLSLVEAEPEDSPAVIVDIDRTVYNYDLGSENSPLFDGVNQGFPYERVTPTTTGDISWSAPVSSTDRGIGSGNGINRDFVTGTTPSVFRHRVDSGLYRITLNMSDSSLALDNMFVNAEGSTAVSDIDRPIGENQNIIFEVTVADAELNLEFGDADTLNPLWTVNRIILLQISSIPTDLDGDGIEDDWEITFFGNLTTTSGAPGEDFDQDLLDDADEFALNTDPTLVDSDGDGAADGLEVNAYGSDPLDIDSDLDGFSDGNEISFASSPVDSNEIPAIPGLVAYYPFEEGTGITAHDIATDDGGQDAMQEQGTVDWTANGLIGSALDLSGNASLLAADAIPAGATELTMSVWINPDVANGFRGIYSGRNTPGNWGLNLNAFRSDHRFVNAAGTSSFGVTSPDDSILASSGWHHLAITWQTDGTTSTSIAYLDGAPIAPASTSATTTYITPSLGYFIGDDPCCNNREFDGLIDDLAVFDRALSEAEIAQIRTNGLAGQPAVSAITPPTFLQINGNVEISDGDVTLEWNSAGGSLTYSVLTTTDLTLPLENWTILAGNVANEGLATRFVHEDALLESRRFYVIMEN